MILSQLNSTHVFMIILWLLYFSIHSLFASLWFKQFILSSYPWIMPWYRLAYNLLAILLLIPPVFLMLMFPGDIVWQWSGNWRYLSYSLTLAAIAGFFLSLKSYDSAEFLGTLQLKEGRKDIKERESFHLSVFHRYVRHPWYVFALILIWTRDMYVSYLISAVLMSLYFILGSYLEEKTDRFSWGSVSSLPKICGRVDSAAMAYFKQTKGSGNRGFEQSYKFYNIRGQHECRLIILPGCTMSVFWYPIYLDPATSYAFWD